MATPERAAVGAEAPSAAVCNNCLAAPLHSSPLPTEADLTGPHQICLMKAAERAEALSADITVPVLAITRLASP
jgi:hypothetical protein